MYISKVMVAFLSRSGSSLISDSCQTRRVVLTCIQDFVPQNSNCELYKLPLKTKNYDETSTNNKNIYYCRQTLTIQLLNRIK